jgi:hypothetical protein
MLLHLRPLGWVICDKKNRSPLKGAEMVSPLRFPDLKTLFCGAALILNAGFIGCTKAPQAYKALAVWSPSSQNFTVALTGRTPADEEARLATGTLYMATPFKGPTCTDIKIRYSCGITFISPHHGVTAAHCVPDFNKGGSVLSADRVKVEMYRFPADLKWQESTHLRGKYPNLHHASIENYEKYVDRFECRVKVRCSSASDGSPINCPHPEHQGTDLALIRCDEPITKRGYRYLSVASEDDMNQPPYLRWTHELYEDSEDSKEFRNYYVIRQSISSNPHYWGQKDGVEFNQLLQLSSSDPSQPNPHVKIPTKEGESTFMGQVRTNVPVCHGTSGAGFLQIDISQNKYHLLGVHHSAPMVGRTSYLCTSGTYSTYSNLEHTQYVASFAND